ncbi:TspO/MBR family protein [Uliginosibacterium paludis]|uniref:TspO/MBR family protein n=1 Tax=Uliginosibacterium paludis TaxID=1615952 RepID=A0ABV2CVH6_9RHOO
METTEAGAESPAHVRQPALHFILWLMPVLITAGIGAIASMDAIRLYDELERPRWAAPANLFAPVWSLLYLLMLLAVWRVSVQAASATRTLALSLFSIQLVANAVWTWLFFARQLGMWAFVDAVFLFLLMSACCVGFMRLDRPAGWMLLPSVPWLAYAAALTLAIWQRNPVMQH